ncbi:MAG: hypothetical protein U0271_09460 [Polyangiaceae bacterium]
MTLDVSLGATPHASFTDVEQTKVGACISIDAGATKQLPSRSSWVLTTVAVAALWAARRARRSRPARDGQST